MEIWMWAVLGVFALVIAGLLIKIRLLQKSAAEIEKAFAEKLTNETNTLIDISSGDRYMKSLASAINTQLVKLRAERCRFVQGDAELKNAVTNISHDLRTPLTVICGYLDLLGPEEKTETVKRYLEVIENRTKMLKRLTEELFRYSVLITEEDHMTRERTVVNAVLEESISAFYAALSGRNIIPVIRLPQTKVCRSLDASALSRVIANLMNNAIKYSDGDLEITLTETGQIVFSNMASGLNEVQVGKLFDRFYTVETARESTGLGLSIARTLVERMGGTISAKYENGRLSICIMLPEQM